MSLVPMTQSSPVILEVNTHLRAARAALTGEGSEPINAGINPYIDSTTAALAEARAAADLIATSEIHPAGRARAALDATLDGVAKLEQVVAFDGINIQAAFGLMDGAAADFTTALMALNRHQI